MQSAPLAKVDQSMLHCDAGSTSFVPLHTVKAKCEMVPNSPHQGLFSTDLPASYRLCRVGGMPLEEFSMLATKTRTITKYAFDTSLARFFT
jgi:hypothetical protein